MLAYVFWHWRRREVDPVSYAGKLAAFHEVLRRSTPEGFVSSCAFRAGAAPWVPAEESYEDWYLTEGSYALDPLNEGAVSGECQVPHDASARCAEGGTAGLYRLRQGVADVREARSAIWFSKPSALSYRQLEERLAPLVESPSVGLWGRQMTLGPTPEFCLLSPSPQGLPPEVAGWERPLERIWPTTVPGLPQEAMKLD